MTRSSNVRAVAITAALFVAGFQVVSMAQSYPAILTGAELQRVVPTGFYFEGQSGPTQIRNAAATRLAEKSYVIAALVDTSGYSNDVRGKYEGFLITDSPISLGGVPLGTGAYGFGFGSDGKVNIFDIGGTQVLSIESKKDDSLKGPRPLMMTKTTEGVRLYRGKSYLTIAPK